MGTHLTTFFHRFHCSVSDIKRVHRYGEHLSAAAAHGACNGCMTSRAAPGSVGPWSAVRLSAKRGAYPCPWSKHLQACAPVWCSYQCNGLA